MVVVSEEVSLVVTVDEDPPPDENVATAPPHSAAFPLNFEENTVSLSMLLQYRAPPDPSWAWFE